MALTYTQRSLTPMNNQGGSVADIPSWALVSITLDGSYATNGVTLSPTQLGFTSSVLGGFAVIRTATANISAGIIDVSTNGTPTAPKLKLFASATTTVELGAAAGSGAVIDVFAFGY